MTFNTSPYRWDKPISSLNERLSLIKEGREALQDQWKGSIKYVNWDGRVVPELSGAEAEASQLFLDSALKESISLSSSQRTIVDGLARKYALGPKDAKKINMALRGEKQALNSRSRKAMADINDLRSEMDEKRTFYTYFGPHGFCFYPAEGIGSSDIAKMISPLLYLKDYHVNGAWISQKVDLFRGPDFLVSFLAYANRKDRRFKTKLYVKHKGQHESPDTLDVETEFKDGRYASIVHYHLEKPSSMMALFGMTQEQVNAKGDSYQLSISPLTGITRVTRWTESRKVITSKESEEANTIALRAIQKKPIMAGGALLEKLIRVVETDPRFQTLIRHSLWYNQ